MGKNPLFSLVEPGSQLSRVLEAIIETPSSTREIAERVDITQRYVCMLVNDLLELGLVKRDKDKIIPVESAKAVMSIVRALPDLIRSVVAEEMSRIGNGTKKKEKVKVDEPRAVETKANDTKELIPLDKIVE